MIEVLYFSDSDVKSKLFSRVGAGTRPLVVTATRQASGMTPPQALDPHATLERTLGDQVDQLLVVDEGTVEGMWRDPMGELADRLFPDDSAQAYLAATGYLVLVGTAVQAIIKKTGNRAHDLSLLLEALAAPKVPPQGGPPPPAPGTSGARAAQQVLGFDGSLPRAEAKKRFHALVAQYHPDKVSHLAPEFRELAERRTRELLAAWEEVEAGYRSKS